jgi:hypothetical protein
VKRADLAIAALVLTLVALIIRHPERKATSATAHRDSSSARRGPSAAPQPRDDRVASGNAAPVRDMEDIRRRIAENTDSYFSWMLRDMGNFITRWPDRRESGLRVWVQTQNPIPDWSDAYAQMARDAFDDWRDGLPARLDFVYDSASADIHLVWTDRFAANLGTRVGVTTRRVDQYGWLVSAQIAIAIHDSAGTAIPPEDLAGIARHEAGHALGLGHSPDPKTKMYPVEMVRNVQPADRATLRLLYSLPPGAVRPTG